MENNKPNLALARKLNTIAYIITGAILILVGVMRKYKIATDIDFSFLPPYHALFNTLVAICLLLAFYYIKQGNVEVHRKFIYGAMTFSALFLFCYVLYHFTTEETKYCREGIIKTVYFILLVSHIFLAGLSLPFILLTFIRGYTNQVAAHRKMAKWVYPIWLYVAVTGPICYLMLKDCYSL
jgi:putative membrane protein